MNNYANLDIHILEKKDFPKKLLEIPQVPPKLYIKGILPEDSLKHLCIVGSRRFTEYGKDVCEKIITELHGFPIVIVSGLAYGIDAIAHKAALDADIKTIAFPGSGLSPPVLYPRGHRELAQKILDHGGALISEFEPEAKAMPYFFPQRNRLMAGISDAVLIIEAEARSGTLITARLATEYNRDVFAAPGSIYSSHSQGPHSLIKSGALLVTSGEDVLQGLGFKITTSEEEFQQEAFQFDESFSPEEKTVLEALRQPLSRDTLFNSVTLSSAEISQTLSLLEIKGLIKESFGQLRRK